MKINKFFLLAIAPVTSLSLTGCSNSKYLPENTLLFSGSVLRGFSEKFNPVSYKSYNALKIPSFCNQIASSAFYASSGSTIPSYITTLEFQKNSKISLGSSCFSYNPFKKIIVPKGSTLSGTLGGSFVSEIDWYIDDLSPIATGTLLFGTVAEEGVMKSLNKEITSSAILWTIAQMYSEYRPYSTNPFANWIAG